MDHVGRSTLGRFAVLAVLMAVLSACRATTADPDVAAVQAVAADTLVAGQKVGVLPGGGVATALTAADVDRLERDADAYARSHYAGPLLANRLALFKETVAAQVGGQPPVLDGGATDIQMGETTVGTDMATVRLRATMWVKLAQGDKVATPTGTADFTFELAKIDGTWYVTAESFDYLPGEGP
jgi:hypothetical protein